MLFECDFPTDRLVTQFGTVNRRHGHAGIGAGGGLGKPLLSEALFDPLTGYPL